MTQRVVPEVLDFLYNSLIYLAPANTFKPLDSTPGLFPTNLHLPTIHIQIKDATIIDKSKLPQLIFFELLNYNDNDNDNNNNSNKDEKNIYDNDVFR